MSKRALILVEGQTEERFVKDVLAPALWTRQLFLIPTLLVTKRVKDGPNFKGGVTNFAKFRNDAERLLNSAGGAMVTTILDYYRLPQDFPGMATRPVNGTPLQRVIHVENAVASHFNNPQNFVPFFALHEFEAWLFASSEELPVGSTKPPSPCRRPIRRTSRPRLKSLWLPFTIEPRGTPAIDRIPPGQRRTSRF
jgi:hypothetical protein